mmetsp:Transcript_148310/g.369727  ORF Transcript_148310/g.369727 Transcript_148310/m.369727 type:complete len:286 (-) Transcript_148310:168-1025(-)
MFSVQVPEGAGPGSTIQVQSPFGNTLQVQVPANVQPGQVFQVQDPQASPAPATVGAPSQQTMGNSAISRDIFCGAKKILVKQEWAAIECCAIEARQRYRISVPGAGNVEGPVFLYITEESNCVERVCCSTNRSLKLKVHEGPSKDQPVVMEMIKPFSLQGCCFLRPSFSVTEQGGLLGEVLDPCRICTMDQQVVDNSKNLFFTTEGTLCQMGIFCPLCSGVNFAVNKNGQKVASIEKMALDCAECFTKTNRFMIDFDTLNEPIEKKMLLASAMLLDLQYFEQKKS